MNRLLEALKTNDIDMVIKEECSNDIVRVEFRKGRHKYVTEFSLQDTKSITANVEFILLRELNVFLKSLPN